MHNTKNYIFYDLETNGLDYYTTGIMQITMLDINENIILNKYVIPFDNRIECSNIHGIDQKKLEDNNAIQTLDLCILIKKIIKDIYDINEIYFIAYNNFGYDQIILENNFKISNIEIPNNWFFIDIYPIIKEIYPNIKPNYKLKTVFENIYNINNNSNNNYHSSLIDTICLYKIYKKIQNKHHYFIKYNRPSLQNNKIFNSSISTLYGYHPNILFEKNNIIIINDIYIIYKNYEFDNSKFKIFLKNNIGIYSNYIIDNIIKQLNIINFLQT